MSLRHLLSLVPILAVMGSLTGCHHAPYGPGYYNYNSYPMGPTMVPQGGYVAPGPAYIPQNMGPSPTPLPGNPGLSPTPINPSQPTPTWRPEGGSNGLQDAPPYKPNPGATNPVPQPFELDPGFDSPPPGASLPRAVPLVQNQPFQASPVAAVTTRNDPDPFEVPKTVTKLPTDLDPFAANPAAPATNGQPQNPYGYDGKSYSWLRGLVDYDVDTRTWDIIYNVAPDIDDKFGGSFVFAPHPALKDLKPGSMVLAKGRIDPGRKDPTGKALYEAAQIIVLSPPAGIQ
ncbi:hypothetical protein GC163_06690 [bacterium]|nr:hypothetical protein [bacterium]